MILRFRLFKPEAFSVFLMKEPFPIQSIHYSDPVFREQIK